MPQACVAIAEPHALFDPTSLKTVAVRTPGGRTITERHTCAHRVDQLLGIVEDMRAPVVERILESAA